MYACGDEFARYPLFGWSKCLVAHLCRQILCSFAFPQLKPFVSVQLSENYAGNIVRVDEVGGNESMG